jgi:hypothetical protein
MPAVRFTAAPFVFSPAIIGFSVRPRIIAADRRKWERAVYAAEIRIV